MHFCPVVVESRKKIKLNVKLGHSIHVLFCLLLLFVFFTWFLLLFPHEGGGGVGQGEGDGGSLNIITIYILFSFHGNDHNL